MKKTEIRREAVIVFKPAVRSWMQRGVLSILVVSLEDSGVQVRSATALVMLSVENTQ